MEITTAEIGTESRDRKESRTIEKPVESFLPLRREGCEKYVRQTGRGFRTKDGTFASRERRISSYMENASFDNTRQSLRRIGEMP